MNQILIIEDDPYVQRFYEHLFRFNNFDVLIAGSGQEGIRLAQTYHPKLILLDIIMPQMDGLQVLTQLKSDPATSDSIIVMLTNIDDPATAKKAAQMGADGFVIKVAAPPEKLLEITKGYLSLSAAA